MPELPEVETVRRDLQAVLPKLTINRARIMLPKIVRGSRQAFVRAVGGRTIHRVDRVGKLLLIRFRDDDRVLAVHLKMTGQLFMRTPRRVIAGGHGERVPDDLPNAYTHALFELSNGATLFFNDQRQFGYLALLSAEELRDVLASYGPEPHHADFTRDVLWQVVRRRKTALKNVLLNQQLIAGLGNIYVDEASFRAGVRPQRRAHRLTRTESDALHQSIVQVITNAIDERGTTFNDFRDAKGKPGNYLRHLKVYGRDGELCRRCRSATIKKIKVNGRGTHYCPTCQS